MKHDSPDAAIVDILRETPRWARVLLAAAVVVAIGLMLVAIVTRFLG